MASTSLIFVMPKLGFSLRSAFILYCCSLWCLLNSCTFWFGGLPYHAARSALLTQIFVYFLGPFGAIPTWVGHIVISWLLAYFPLLPENIQLLLSPNAPVIRTNCTNVTPSISSSMFTSNDVSAAHLDPSGGTFDKTTLFVDSIFSLTVLTIFAIITDVSHRNIQHDLQVATAHKSEFVARMSHELRTPLFGIVGCLELLESTGLDKQQESLMNMGKTCCKNLIALIDDILDMSKIEAGKLVLDLQTVQTDKIIDESLKVVWARASMKNVSLSYKLHPAVPRHFLGDAIRSKQVLVNLLSNSVKFTAPHGKVKLEVAFFRQIKPAVRAHVFSPKLPIASLQGKEQHGYLGFTITDTGIGLVQEEMGRIFNSFEQADSTDSRPYGGTGLGLTISASLVAQMGGHFFVCSDGKGKGTIFQFFIPFLRPPHNSKTQKKAGKSKEQVSQKRAPKLSSNFWGSTSSLFSKCGGKAPKTSPIGRGYGPAPLRHNSNDSESSRDSDASDLLSSEVSETLPSIKIIQSPKLSDKSKKMSKESLRRIKSTGDLQKSESYLMSLEHSSGDVGNTKVLPPAFEAECIKMPPLIATKSRDNLGRGPLWMAEKKQACTSNSSSPSSGADLQHQSSSCDGNSIIHSKESEHRDDLISHYDIIEDDDDHGQDRGPQTGATTDLKESRILVVEDNLMNQKIIKTMLHKLGQPCDIASNGVEAWQLAQKRFYRLILLDIEMPVMSGVEAAAKIRELGITTPIVALSAHALAEKRAEALASGMDDFVCKPITSNMLQKVLKTWLN